MSEPKRPENLFRLRGELASLLEEKRKWESAQKRASFLISPYRIDEWNTMRKFAALLQKVHSTPIEPYERNAKNALMEQIIQESIIIEWPKIVHGLGREKEGNAKQGSHINPMKIDHSPLIHRARSVVKSRTPHPTMRIRVCAIERCQAKDQKRLKVLESFFRATLVKLSADTTDRHTVGQLILTQREGIRVTPIELQKGATATSNGSLVVSQANETLLVCKFPIEYGESVRAVELMYDDDCLCAVFPQIGVKLNSMVDRRQLTTRYAIQVDVALNISDQMIVKHRLPSHEFLIAITYDQTEPLLTSIIWERLAGCSYDASLDQPYIEWRILRKFLRNFIKSQLQSARLLSTDELLHIQCMLLLPRIIRCRKDQSKLDVVEKELFENVASFSNGFNEMNIARLKQRLLNEPVSDAVLVSKEEFMQEKCISIVDTESVLEHSVWQWFYKATELVIDVGHKYCPSPTIILKRDSLQSKRHSTDEFPTMLHLFNTRVITFSSAQRVLEIFKMIKWNNQQDVGYSKKVMMIRFCDENANHLSISFHTSQVSSKPLTGSISKEYIKDFKHGLAEILIDEPFPKLFDHIVRFEFDRSSKSSDKLKPYLAKTRDILSYTTFRMKNDQAAINDHETIRINPATGERIFSCSQQVLWDIYTWPSYSAAFASFVTNIPLQSAVSQYPMSNNFQMSLHSSMLLASLKLSILAANNLPNRSDITPECGQKNGTRAKAKHEIDGIGADISGKMGYEWHKTSQNLETSTADEDTPLNLAPKRQKLT